jgi:hypothetical protein
MMCVPLGCVNSPSEPTVQMETNTRHRRERARCELKVHRNDTPPTHPTVFKNNPQPSLKAIRTISSDGD